ncbi:hypothetical protein [Paraburkholderia tropica]|uniref:hypothetical protein n=1 Tax=Paraburkholderia tropica TaxID=92647 RepID=UPI001CC388F1|nr:hypothetical protein [Paraburkholderia tropica]
MIDVAPGAWAASAEDIAEVMREQFWIVGGRVVRWDGDEMMPMGAREVEMRLCDQRQRAYVAGRSNGRAARVPADLLALGIAEFKRTARKHGRVVDHKVRWPMMVRDRGGWLPVPVATAGVLRVGKTLVCVEGDGAKDALALADNAAFVRAVEVVMAPFAEYRLADQRHQALVLAAMLTAANRPALRTAPAIVIESPLPRSGKTLLADSIGALVPQRDDYGSVAVSMPTKEEEIEKRVSAWSESDEPVVSLDNLTGLVASDALTALITSGVAKYRPFGSNTEMCTVDFRGLIVMTGNNAKLSRDLRARSLNIRIDTGSLAPETIVHAFHPLEKIESERAEIAAAAIGILSARGAAREQWMRDVSPDFADLIAPAVRRACELMPERFEWPASVAVEMFPTDGPTAVVSELLEALVGASDERVSAFEAGVTADEMRQWTEVIEVMEPVLANNRKGLNRISLSQELAKLNGVPCEFGRITQTKRTATTKPRWRVEFSPAFREQRAKCLVTLNMDLD